MAYNFDFYRPTIFCVIFSLNVSLFFFLILLIISIIYAYIVNGEKSNEFFLIKQKQLYKYNDCFELKTHPIIFAL